MAIVVAVAAILILGRVTGDLAGATDAVEVLRVIDGDTIIVASGEGSETVRLLGIDTPETHHPTKPVGCWGPEAEAFTREHLEGRFVTLEDEDGMVNVVVWRDLGERQRRVLVESRLMGVAGRLEAVDGVRHVIAATLFDESALAGALQPASRDFR